MTLRQRFMDAKYDAVLQAEGKAIYDLQVKMAAEDGVSLEEMMRMCIEEPKYSLAVKLQRYMVDSSLQPTKMKKLKKEFIESLTPEERKIYDEEVVGMDMHGMVKKAVKEQVKVKKKKVKV